MQHGFLRQCNFTDFAAFLIRNAGFSGAVHINKRAPDAKQSTDEMVITLKFAFPYAKDYFKAPSPRSQNSIFCRPFNGNGLF